VILNGEAMEKRLGVYIHIPFCASKCGYCDFYSRAGCDERMPAYEEALISHLHEAAPTMASYQIDTVYFGGGTPSYFGAKRICDVFPRAEGHGTCAQGLRGHDGGQSRQHEDGRTEAAA
jgi:coproporphyrinogen III oxidase-like Fe-S oxidoreductase